MIWNHKVKFIRLGDSGKIARIKSSTLPIIVIIASAQLYFLCPELEYHVVQLEHLGMFLVILVVPFIFYKLI